MSPHATPFLFAPFGFLLVVLLAGAIGYVGVKFARNGSTETPETGSNQALETLRRRYASGEIDAEEFQERKEHLRR